MTVKILKIIFYFTFVLLLNADRNSLGHLIHIAASIDTKFFYLNSDQSLKRLQAPSRAFFLNQYSVCLM